MTSQSLTEDAEAQRDLVTSNQSKVTQQIRPGVSEFSILLHMVQDSREPF